MLLGRILGYHSAESNSDSDPEFRLNALAVLKDTGRPSAGDFFGWAREVGLLSRSGEEAATDF